MKPFWILFSAVVASTLPARGAELAFRDDFSASQLSPGWTLIRPDPSAYSLTSDPGFFRVLTARGILGEEGTARNLLVRPVQGDFILDTKLRFDPRDGQPFAGLLVYQDDAHVVTLGLVFVSGERGAFRGVVLLNLGDGVDTEHRPAARYDEGNAPQPEVIYLRLLRQGSQFVGAYSSDGVSFRDLGIVNNSLAGSLFVGIGAANGDSENCGAACDVAIPALFDYFQISSLDGGGNGGPPDANLDSVDILGPDEVPAGEAADYSAIANYSDGSTLDVTAVAQWMAAPPDAATVSAGTLTAMPLTQTRLTTLVATYAQDDSIGTQTVTGTKLVKIVTSSSPRPSLRVCGAGVAFVFPLMCLVKLLALACPKPKAGIRGKQARIA